MGTLAYGNTAKPYQVTMLTPTGTAVPAREQNVTYTSYQRPNSITENGITATFAYNAGGDRMKMNVMQGTNALLTRYYIGKQYELDAQTNTERLYLGGDVYSAPAVYVKENNVWNIYYICRDYLGSVTHVTNANGSLKAEYSYDAWGRLRNSASQVAYTPGTEPALFLARGYTGHEYLPWFGLVNMNARLYDAALGRFLSADPYVQAPNFTQNFNRYSYCLNNPLVYVDENGEWNWIVAGIGFVYGYLNHGITKGDWGWKALGSGALTGVMWGIGYTSSMAAAGITPLSYAGQSALTSTLNQFMPSMSIPIGSNFSINTSFGLGISPGGLVGGMNLSATYHNGDFALTGGVGASGNMSSWGGGISYKDVGISYYQTTFGDAVGPDGVSNSQILGGLGLNIGKFSLRVENDFFGDKGDRWRTSAVEIGIGNFVIGKSVYTNEPDGTRSDGYSHFWKKGKAAYADGTAFSSPLYIGARHGGRTTRIGINHPVIQDITQNGVHLLRDDSPLFPTPYGVYSSAYRYSGYYNPYSLYYK